MEKEIWFKEKKYGWGWTPATWQGWLATILYMALIIGPVFLFTNDLERFANYTWEYVAYTCVLSAAFIFLCYKKGVKPQWHWGDKD